MKKFTALLLTLVLCLSMVACGSSGPDKPPAIAWGEEDIEFMNNCADVINEYGTKLDSDGELTQEEIDEMVDMFDEFNGIIEEYLQEAE